jgi:hypothetical protein
MSHDNANVRSVVAKIVAGATVAAAIVATSMGVGRDVTPDTHSAIFAADEILKSMGRSEADIVTEVKRRTGADVAPDGAVVADVVRAAHSADRDPRTLRSERLVMHVPVAVAPGFDLAWGAVFCEPLKPVKANDTTDLYDACVVAQTGSASAVRCVGGLPAGYVVELPATPALYARAVEAMAGGTLAGVIEAMPQGWEACPDVAP